MGLVKFWVIHMFDIDFPFYGIAITLALISNIILVLCLYKKYDYDFNEIIGLLLYENVGIIGGAKILSYLLNSKAYVNFNFLNLGLTSYGAILGALMLLYYFACNLKNRLKILYLYLYQRCL